MISDELRLRWIGWRNHVLASGRFRGVAARFPLTRGVARRRARTLFDLVAGFTYSQTLFACVELDVFGKLPASTDYVADRTGLSAAAAERLLKAAAALDLTERVGDVWTLGPAGAALAGDPGIAAMVAHHDALYADLADPVALLQRGGGGGALSRYWGYAESPGEGDEVGVAPYSRLMAASLPMVAQQAFDAYPFARHRRVLDVGGGQGAFLSALARHAPKLERGLFDLPAVVERAREQLGASVALHPGDFTRDPLPQGYDLITLVRILHDHDDAPVRNLLRSARGALAPGGRLLIVEPMAGSGPEGDAYFGLYLLAMGSGRPRSPAEYRTMLDDAGFRSVRMLRTHLPLIAQAIVAEA